MNGRVIGIDIGGTNFRIGLVDDQGGLSDFRKVPVSEVFCTDDPIFDLADYISRHLLTITDVAAVSIGFPSPVDKDHKRVLQAPNVNLPPDLSVVDELSKALGIPVFIANDVELALMYDVAKLKIPTEGIVAGIYFGTGIGNAIMIDGEILPGKNGVSGEIGHIPVDGNDLVCGCGNVGCMESVAGGNYLDRLCREIYKDTHVSEIFVRHGKDDLLLQFVDRMAMTVATEVTILDPDHMLIGGGVPEIREFPGDLLKERILFHTRKPYPAENLDLVFTGDAKEKCVLAAASYAFQKLI